MIRIHLLAAATALTASAAFSEPTLVERTQVLLLWEEARQEHIRLLTCAQTLDPQTRELMSESWEDMINDTAEIMADAGMAADLIAEQLERSAISVLVLPPETPFGEVVELCQATNWMQAYRFFDIVVLPTEVSGVLE